ncbi:MAG: hypothetical protein ACI36Z_03120, partial [Alloprevotella sp.]
KMATINTTKSYPQKFNFIGDPIMVYASGSFPSSSTFRKLVFTVSINFQGASYAYPFELSVEESEEIGIDVSSALRSAMQRWDYPLDSITKSGTSWKVTYPSATFQVSVHERYMTSGDIYNKSEVNTQQGYAYYGRLGEYDRMTIGNHPSEFVDSLRFTRYPDEKKQYGVGDWSGSSTYQDGDVSTTFTPKLTGQLRAGRYLHFLFVNSLGVFETVSAIMRETMNYDMTTTSYSVEQSPSYEQKPNRRAVSTAGRGSFEMSSGYVTHEEADWWATEFLTARKHWVRMGVNRILADGSWSESSLWLPVAITPSDESVTVYNKEERMLPHIDFTAEVAVSGSLLTTVAGL